MLARHFVVRLLKVSLLVVVVLPVSAVPPPPNDDSMACLKVQFWTNDACSEDPDNSVINTVPTMPSEKCVPFDDPTFGKCSLNHQHCDMLINAFKETVYIADDSCDKTKAFFVQEQSYESGKCYGGSGQSVIVECLAGACPSSAASQSIAAATAATTTMMADHRTFILATRARMMENHQNIME